MDIYIKSWRSLGDTARFEAEAYSCYLGTASDQRGNVTIPAEISDRTGDWAVMDGRVYTISSCVPEDGRTELSLADPINYFNRDVFFRGAEANAAEFITRTLTREFIEQEDPEYRIGYMKIVNNSRARYFEPELDDDVFNVAEYLKTAVSNGVKMDWAIQGRELVLTLSDRVKARHVVSFEDGRAQLVSSQFSSKLYAKCTVRKPEPVEDDAEQEYSDSTWYLNEDGTASENAPLHRQAGKWSIVVCTQDEEPREVAEELFSGNSYGYKVEFYSSREYKLFDEVILRLPSGNVSAAISEISVSSADSRFRYQCGQMTTTVKETIKTVTTTIAAEATVGENTTALQAYPVGSIYITTGNVSPAALFGGTWRQIKGRFLLGASSEFAAGSTGGEKEHTLTVEEMPAHSHSGLEFTGGYSSIKGGTAGGRQTGSTGGGQPHNNMPPYLSVFIWERTG